MSRRDRARRVASGGSPFSPIKTPNKILWLRSDLGVTRVNPGVDDHVTDWADQSGAGNHVTQAVAANQGTWSASLAALNGHPVIRFESGDFMRRVTYVGGALATCTVYAAGVRNSGTTKFFVDGGAPTTRTAIFYGTTIDNIAYAGASLIVSFGSSAVGLSYWARHISLGTTGSSIYAEGDGIGTATTTGSSGVQDMNGVTIGQGGDDTGTTGDLYIAEAIVINGTLSAADATALENYLRARYGIAP